MSVTAFMEKHYRHYNARECELDIDWLTYEGQQHPSHCCVKRVKPCSRHRGEVNALEKICKRYEQLLLQRYNENCK